MKQLLKPFLINALAKVHAFPTRMTDPAEIQFFLNKLHPISTNKKLIRLGPNRDGGYLVPNDLENIEACFSPGVSSESGFEKDCAERGMKIFLADKSVEKPTIDHDLFQFTKKFIGVTTNDDFMTLDGWVASSLASNDSDLLLQIDIEEYEYEVFLSVSPNLMQRFRIIVAEFHNIEQLWSKPFFNLITRVFDKILQTHACVHIHPNNNCGYLSIHNICLPKVMEFTFLRRDRIEYSSYEKNFPNPLDFENVSKTPLVLPKCWYTNE